jgi:hypothetical protein
MLLTFCGWGGFALVCGIPLGCGIGNTRKGFRGAAQTTCLPAVRSPGWVSPEMGHPGTGSAGMRIGFAGVGAHTSALANHPLVRVAGAAGPRRRGVGLVVVCSGIRELLTSGDRGFAHFRRVPSRSRGSACEVWDGCRTKRCCR